MPRKGTQPSSLNIHLLGPCRLEVGGAPVTARRQARRLIVLLALQPQHRLHREQAVEFMWPGQGLESALNNLYKTVHAARRALEPELVSGSDSHFVLTRDQHIILAAPRELLIDIEAFEERAADALGREGDGAACEAALALYGGELLADEPYEEWAAARRERLRLTHQSLLFKLAALYEEGGRHEQSVGLYHELVAADSLNEEAHRRLMLLYARAGDRRRALRQFGLCRAALSKELGVEPEAETVEVYERIARGRVEPPPPRADGGVAAAAARPKAVTNLPHQVTSFVGRAREVAEGRRMLAGARLLTLTGTGGIGKTRLALEVAAGLRDDFADGVWLVELASLADEALVPKAVASALGLSAWHGRAPADALLDSLRGKQALLLFDNCEHVVAACAALAAALLRACPGVRVLATSREALGVPGEVVWRVAALSLPQPGARLRAANAGGYEAVQLFLERARLSNPRWALDEQNAETVADICRRLDGMPLAIELAAARVRVLTASQVLAKLDDRFHLLTEGGRTVAQRHRTLRATVDWSYGLLSREEQVLCRRLSVFVGGWSLEAAEAVCAGEGLKAGEVLDVLSRLVNKSLVLPSDQPGGGATEARYGFLETIRQYAAEKLHGSREHARVRARHFAWFLRLAERAEEEFSGPELRAWFERLETEHHNLRAALHWGVREARDAERALRLCSALWRFWQAHGHLSEGRRWFEEALSLGGTFPVPLQAKAFHGASALASMQGDFEHARVFLERSLALRRETGDRRGAAHELQRLGIISYYVGDYRRAVELQEESLRLCQELGDRHGAARAMNGLGVIALDQGDYGRAAARFEECLSVYRGEDYGLGVMVTLNNLGETAQRRGDLDRADELLGESLAMARELGDRGWIARALYVLGNVACDRGDCRAAMGLFEEALAIFREIGDSGVVHALEGLARTASARGEAERALRLAGAASSLREATRMKRTPVEQFILGRCLDESRHLLSAEKAERELAAGHAMTLERAAEYALRAG